MTSEDQTMPACRICGSEHTAFVRNVPMRRSKQTSPLFYCLFCESFTHPQIYTEPDDQLERDAEWHITVEERNTRWANNFLNGVVLKRNVGSIVEIGCATGTMLSEARKRAIQVYGFDTNPYVKKLAWERHGINVQDELWDRTSIRGPVDLVACISVMEHLPDPQTLMFEIGAYCSAYGAAAYISVPFMTEKRDLHWLEAEVPETSANPFYLVDVHINHFSRTGFELMAKRAGAKVISPEAIGWIGYYLEF